jgi:hypothetical protein
MMVKFKFKDSDNNISSKTTLYAMHLSFGYNIIKSLDDLRPALTEQANKILNIIRSEWVLNKPCNFQVLFINI